MNRTDQSILDALGEEGGLCTRCGEPMEYRHVVVRETLFERMESFSWSCERCLIYMHRTKRTDKTE